MTFSPFDIAIVVAYVATLLIVGVWLRRRASRGLDHYLLGGRSTSWWMLGVSGVMDFWDLAGSIVIVSFLYLMGPAGLFVEFRGGAVLVLAVVMLWTGKWRRRSGCRTGAEWMRFRFGHGPAGKLAQSTRAIGGIALFIGLVAFATKALGVFLSSVVPLTPAEIGLAVVSLVAAYSVFSGFYGLVAIQALQFVCVIVSAVTIVCLAITVAPPADDLRNMAISVTGNPGWGQLMPGDKLSLPGEYAAYEPLLFLATIYLLRNIFFGMGAGDDPKCFAAQHDSDCPKLSLLWISLIAIRWPTMMAFAVLAIAIGYEDAERGVDYKEATRAIRMYFPSDDWAAVVATIQSKPSGQPAALQQALRHAIGEDWPLRVADLTERGTLDPEKIIAVVLERAVPTGLRGLILVSLLAAATAGLSGWLNQAAGLFANDVYLVWFRPSASTFEQIGVAWVMVLIVVAFGYALAFSSPTVNDIWSWLTMGLGSGLIVAQMLPLYWSRFNGIGFACGLMGGVLAAAVHRIAAPQLDKSLDFVSEEWFLLLFVSIVGLVASVAGTWLSPPTPDGTLREFYRRTLPFGWWKQDQHSLTPSHARALARCHAREVGALPFALIYQMTIFLSPMLAVTGDWIAATACGLTAVASLAGLWLIYFRRLEEEAELVHQIGVANRTADSATS